MNHKKTILIILDGWGHGPRPEASAIAQAATPFMDSLYAQYPHAELVTYGEEVGLPEGQMGNSEVGHLNIGAGRVVYQELARINKAIREETLAQNPTLQAALRHAREAQKPLHLLGLLSDGGVHSHIEHLKALVAIAEAASVPAVYIHAFTDGRDVAPTSGRGFVRELEDFLKDKKAQLASVVGRYYAMDRDRRWERIRLAYDLLVKGLGSPVDDWDAGIAAQYAAGRTDEFLEPMYRTNAAGKALATIQPDDVVLFYNFRTDRPRQLTEALTQADFPERGMQRLPLYYVTMTRYDAAFENVEVLFTKADLVDTLGEVLAKAGKSQVRIAETEKYPHVTFFFSGGREREFPGERRLLVPSPKVATYDLQPEMSAREITDAIVADIQTQGPDFICLNYANTDMVGHTGVFPAAIRAAGTVDACLRELLECCLREDYAALIIADHGNSDCMINPDGSPHTAHTVNPVPILYVAKEAPERSLRAGRLADVAPTLLALMGLAQPELMDGQNLIE
ncbi:MAG: 2,3-bisphosphoglycerate-independent phosphoglycerate mutase [Bacteroidota bacterium]